MIPAVDITADTHDITDLWSDCTGDIDVTATAHMRGGQIVTVSIRPADRALIMCRAGAAAILGNPTLDAIEQQARPDALAPPHPKDWSTS